MRRIANLILMFMVGFFGGALIIDDSQELLIAKAKIMFVGVLISSVLHGIVDYKKIKK